MSQTPTEPTTTEIMGKVIEAVAAVQDAEQTVVAEGQRLVHHMADPAAHGAGVAANIEAAMPKPVWSGTALKFTNEAGTINSSAVNLQGPQGDPPAHKWDGNNLSLQNPDGTWGDPVDLQGPTPLPGAGLVLDSANALSVKYGTAAGTACQGNDARLSNARTPTAHKDTHKTGGADALTPADIGAAANTLTITAGNGLTGGGNLTANRTLAVKLVNAVNSTDATSAATANAVKIAYDKAVAAYNRPLYELGEFYFFRHPTLKPGFQPAQGGLITGAATKYPEVWAYLQTTEGKKLCKTEAEWQALTKATWATLADGTKVGWDGIGGAPFYAPNTATGALRLPDLRGMYAEAAGVDALGVGGVHGDGIRDITGRFSFSGAHLTQVFGAFGATGSTVADAVSPHPLGTATFDASRVVPTATVNRPRAWGALACVYLGAPR